MLQYRSAGETVRIGKFGTFAISRGFGWALGSGKFGVLWWFVMFAGDTLTPEGSQAGCTWKISVSNLVEIISVRVRGLARGA